MNTPQSMAIGLGSLVLAAGVSFYYAKKGIDARRREQAVEGSRPTAKLSWEQRIAMDEAQMKQAKASSVSVDQLQQRSGTSSESKPNPAGS